MDDALWDDALWRLDAVATAHLIRTGRASARQVTRSVLHRMEAVNPKLNAVVVPMAEAALAAAAAADEAQARGKFLAPLHGVPVTVKVNTDQKGQATSHGVVAFRDNVAAEDAPVIANLRRAGAIIIGTGTIMLALAFHSFGGKKPRMGLIAALLAFVFVCCAVLFAASYAAQR